MSENNTISNSKKTRDMVYIGVFAALLGVLSQIAIPLPTNVPITLQTFAVALAGYFLGEKRGAISVLVFILIGAVGVPVFANFRGGISVLTGFTGGFVFGFIVLAFFCGLGSKTNKIYFSIALGLIGLVINHIMGAVQYMVLAELSFGKAILTVSLPYLIKDALSIVAAQIVSVQLLKRVPVFNKLSN